MRVCVAGRECGVNCLEGTTAQSRARSALARNRTPMTDRQTERSAFVATREPSRGSRLRPTVGAARNRKPAPMYAKRCMAPIGNIVGMLSTLAANVYYVSSRLFWSCLDHHYLALIRSSYRLLSPADNLPSSFVPFPPPPPPHKPRQASDRQAIHLSSAETPRSLIATYGCSRLAAATRRLAEPTRLSPANRSARHKALRPNHIRLSRATRRRRD